MATVTLSARALEHLEQIFEFVAERDPGRALEIIQHIREAVMVLERHPLIGRTTRDGLRELVISRGRNAYVALYRWHQIRNAVLVLAIRDARTAGYPAE